MNTHPIHDLADDLLEKVADLDPVGATFMGLPGRDDRWPDLSPEGRATAGDVMATYQQRLGELPPPGDDWEALAIDVAAEFLDQQLIELGDEDAELDLNSIASPSQNFREVFDHMDTDSADGWRNVASRLRALGQALDGYVTTLRAGMADGRTVAGRQVAAVAAQAEINASEESGFVELAKTYTEQNSNGEMSEEIEGAALSAREAFARFADFLRSDYFPRAVVNDAVGEERYLSSARRFLGTAVDPAETYAWGWSELGELRQRMIAIADKIVPGEGVAGALDLLKTDPDRAIADHDGFVAWVEALQQDALAQLSEVHFDVPDQIQTVGVAVAPPGGSLGAYYVSPSEDFSRPGRVWYSFVPNEPIPLYDHVSTAYHEGFPGHHLQDGIQVANSANLTRLHRKAVWLSGSGEGWALYAERLMDELGFLENPDYELGYLAAQMLRACRVVIDIGVHLGFPIPKDQPFHPGETWTYDTAVELLMTGATLDRPYAESEVTRYLGWPGQAIAYKVGERHILDWREQTRRDLGAEFDLKRFHARLLAPGAIGLDLLRPRVLEES